ncbi:MAG TPA: hypothetical protein VK504_20295 [Vicinamibacterales bacterium]|nr:hypothetical protein [Vicinamibacterales bacterium]
MPVTADITLSITGQQTSVLDLGTAAFPFALTATSRFTSGTGASQLDRVFADTRTLAPSATEDLDLAGTLLDAFGAAITFVKLKGLFIRSAAANLNSINVSRPAGATGVPIFLAISDGIVIPPGYTFAWFGTGTGITVTPSTADLITIANAAGTNSVTYDVVIVGVSA